MKVGDLVMISQKGLRIKTGWFPAVRHKMETGVVLCMGYDRMWPRVMWSENLIFVHQRHMIKGAK